MRLIIEMGIDFLGANSFVDHKMIYPFFFHNFFLCPSDFVTALDNNNIYREEIRNPILSDLIKAPFPELRKRYIGILYIISIMS